MDSNDIRKRFHISNPDDEGAADILETRPPSCSTTGEHSGIDCLITVLRRVYSHSMLGPEGLATEAWLRSAESENSILTHAWHMFGQSEWEKSKAADARTRLLEALNAMGMSGTESFAELDRSPLMARTFWGQKQLGLFKPIINLAGPEPVPLSLQKQGEMSLVRVLRQHAPEHTVQDRLIGIFGMYVNSTERTIVTPSMPEIIRVEYHPAEDPSDRPPFESFRQVDLPVYRLHYEDGRIYFDKTGREPYTLIAVVRHRDEPTGRDSVRTYSAHEANIVPEYEPISYTPGNWSPHIFTLFYGLSDKDMLPLETFPELERRVVGLDACLRFENTLQSHLAPRTTQSAERTAHQESEAVLPQPKAPVTEHIRQRQGDSKQQVCHSSA
ncbi:hypothetical protein ACHAPT_013608 [Fusarium lateritium]